jgi:hypothetical protein
MYKRFKAQSPQFKEDVEIILSVKYQETEGRLTLETKILVIRKMKAGEKRKLKLFVIM